ncbi:hypothetical protein SAMN04490244_10677 [Tranquillimonas rosea]|uniref:Uncharacterized protein n=1 Tax=Tranquillimonas rosea TaxID=641238 RepID=A0A1H9UXW7_9RHOB|nr:DUF1178 family protein [Tranquillimonas rosea]SES14189.1 hypothetical protein SAMN04490244_10677 [Tranquillimonas rosea]
MIHYTLKCPDAHVFESWFQSAAAFDSLQAAGHVTCPECGADRVEKAMMAPRIGQGRDARPQEGPSETSPAKEHPLAALKRKIESNSDYVGQSFVSEARAMHEGTAPKRSIYGEARLDEARKLAEDGVPVAPLPFVPTRKSN